MHRPGHHAPLAWICFTVLVMLLAASCSSKTPSTPASAAKEEVASAPTSPASTADLSEAAPAVIPSATSRPTQARTPTPNATRTATYTPTDAATATSTPVPSPAVPVLDAARAESLCDSAVSQPISSGSPIAPFFSFRNKVYDSAGTHRWDHLIDPWYESLLNGLVEPSANDFPSPIIEAAWIDHTQTLSCIREDRTAVGSYTDGASAYQLAWQVRLLLWPGGEIIAETSFTGGNPPETKGAGTGPGYGSPPTWDYYQWLFDLLQDKSILSTGAYAPITILEYSPDGQYLATYTDGLDGVVLRSTAGFQIVQSFGWASDLAFSPDGRILAGAREQGIGLWDVASGQEIRAIQTEFGIASITFSPDGTRLASGDHAGAVQLWDVGTGQMVDSHAGAKTSDVIRVAFSPDGSTLVAINKAYPSQTGNEVNVWNVADGRLLRTFSLGDISNAAISPDFTTIATVGIIENLTLWDLESGQAIRSMPESWGSSLVVFSPDGKTVATQNSSRDSTTLSTARILLWDTETGERTHLFSTNATTTRSLAFSPDGKLLAAGDDAGAVKLWDVASGE